MRHFRKYLICSLLFFLASSIIGVWVSSQLTEKEIDIFQSKGHQILITLGNKTRIELLKEILLTNTVIMLLNFIGAFTFGLSSAVTTFINGFMAGQLFYNSCRYYSLAEVCKHILPHSGEFIAVIISAAIGIYGVKDFIHFIKTSEPPSDSARYLIYGAVTIGLTIVSAFLEVFVSAQ